MRGSVAYALYLPVFTGLSLIAQSPHTKPHPIVHTATHADTTHPLKVTHVSLYKNGVGYFEHEANITGDAAVRLDLTSAQLNDVLQSLTALDLNGGHITGANYNSTTPLEQQLQSLPLSLGEQPSQEDLFNTLRGARAEVSGPGATFTGRLLSLELRTDQHLQDNKPASELRFLTLISETGVTRTIELTSTTSVHLLDPALQADLNTYLELLDRNRTEGTRHLVLTDNGTGTRTIHVGFLSEVPVWKSTYRLLLTSTPAAHNSTATVQGFSVIDNTTGEDWNNIQLSLIAGSPQSFLQPISQPIYDRRPEVPIAENAQTTPQTHDSAEGTEPPPGSASADLSSSAGGNPTALFGSPTGTGSGAPHAAAARPAEIDQALRVPSKIPKNITMMKDTGPPPPPMAVALPRAAAASPAELEYTTRISTQVKTTTTAFDDFFAYNLSDPVTIPRNGSALVPILQAQLPVESVTLWSAQRPQPLRALWLTNNTELTLDRGSFSVVEDGAFAGEGLTDPVHPGERRLLSYAADQAVRVTSTSRGDVRTITSFSAAKGVLRIAHVVVAPAEYTVSNAAPAARTVIVEEPRRAGWTLDPSTLPAETTPNVYRFRVSVAPHSAAHLAVTQRQTVDQDIELADFSEVQIYGYLQNYGGNADLMRQLEPVFAARRKVADLDAQITTLHAKERTIAEDQKRLRENMTALKGSAEEKDLIRRYTAELNAQEDTLASTHRQLATVQDQRTAALAALSDTIASLQINETAAATPPTLP